MYEVPSLYLSQLPRELPMKCLCSRISSAESCSQAGLDDDYCSCRCHNEDDDGPEYDKYDYDEAFVDMNYNAYGEEK